MYLVYGLNEQNVNMGKHIETFQSVFNLVQKKREFIIDHFEATPKEKYSIILIESVGSFQ